MGSGRLNRFGRALLAGWLALCAPMVFATIIEHHNPFERYGRVAQPACPIFGICVGVSAINSFVYLKSYKYYRDTDIDVGTKPTAAEASRDFAEYGWRVDGVSYLPYYSRGGDHREAYLATVTDWIESFAPGRTAYDGMWEGRGSGERNAVPSWEFLLEELKDHEAVQLFITTGTGADTRRHAVTLTGVKYDDRFGCDTAFNCRIFYQDPNRPETEVRDVPLTLDASGRLSFFDPNPQSDREWAVYAAFSQSPVPAPGTVWLLIGGVIALSAANRSFRLAGRRVAGTPGGNGVRRARLRLR